jgi:hypothetical protein
MPAKMLIMSSRTGGLPIRIYLMKYAHTPCRMLLWGLRSHSLEQANRYAPPEQAQSVPELAGLDAHGQLRLSPQDGEFDAMRHSQSSPVNEFLLHWESPRS